MKSIIIHLERKTGGVIPFDYNYYLAMNFYYKLEKYQKEIRKLHEPKTPSLYTFSNIITDDAKIGDNGISIERGFLVFRSTDKNLIDYLRLGMAMDNNIQIINSLYKVTRVKDIKDPNFSTEVKFKTLSPAIIRNFDNRKMYVSRIEDVEKNLNMSMRWLLKNIYRVANIDIGFKLTDIRMKTSRISSTAGKNSITKSFNLEGIITGHPSNIEILFYHGMGSKTGLGLGCWEVIS